MKIKQCLLASTLCVLPFAASAADLPVKAPARVVQPIPFTWTGFYVGGSAGFISQNTTVTDIDGALFVPGDTYGIPGHGGLFGVNVGYNYQMGAVVFGLEADIAFSTLDDSIALTPFGSINLSSKVNSLGTVRGRIGYAFDRALLYATGGWAYGHVENSLTSALFPAANVSLSNNRSGWTIGGGLEYAMTNNWTIRAEGLYVDLGDSTGVSSVGCRWGFKNTDTIGRLGLNYKF